MPLFIAYRRWQQEQTKLVAKKVIEASGSPREGAVLMSSYMRADQTVSILIPCQN